MENKEQSSEASDDEMFVEVQSGEISSDSTIPDYSSTSFPANDDTEVEEITNAQSEISSVAPVPETNCAIVISDSTSATTLYDIDDIPNVSSSENDRTLSDIETHNTGVSESVTACSRHEEGRTTLTQNESIRLHRDDKKSLPVHSEPVAVEVKATDGQAENMSRTAVFAESNFVTTVISSSTSVSSVCDSDEVHSLSGSVPDYTLTDPETSNVEPDDDAAVCCRNDKHSVTLLPHRTPTSCIAVRMRSGRMYFTCVSQANSVNVRKLRKSSALKCPIPHVVLTRIDTVPVSLRRVRNSPTVQKEGTKCSAPSSTATTHGLPEAMVFSPITSNATSLLPSPEESCHLSEDYVTVNAPCTATPIKEKHSVTDGGLSIEDAHSVVDNLLLTDNSVSAAMNEPGNLSTNCNTGSDRLTAGEPTSNKNMFNFVESEAAESSDKVSEIAAVDESSCHSVGSKRPHVDDLAEGSHPKQQKMEDSNSPFSRVTPVCHDMSQPSAEQPMNTEVLAPGVVIDIDVVEKTHTDKCQPVTCLPTDTNFMETEGGTLAGQTEISSMNDAIAVNENALVRDSSVFTTPSASNIVTNIEAGEETHATKSQRGSYVVAAKNDMMAEQLVVDALSSANDAIADNDNLLAPDSSAFTAAAEPSVDTNIEAVEDSDVSNSQQEFTTLPIDLNFVTTEDDMMAEQLFVDVKSSVNDVIADNDNLLAPDSSAFTAETEPRVDTNIEAVEDSDVSKSQQEVTTLPIDLNFVATEEDMMAEQLFVDVKSSVNDVIADNDNLLAPDSSAFTAAAEPRVDTNIEAVEETVVSKSQQEATTVPIDLNFAAKEDDMMAEQLFVDVKSSVNDAVADNDNLLAPVILAFTAETEPSVVTNIEAVEDSDVSKSQQEVTTLPIDLNFVTTEDDMMAEQLFVDVKSSVNDAVADNDNLLAPDSSALTAATEPSIFTNIEVIEEADITESEQEVTIVPTDSYFVTTEDAMMTEQLFVDVISSVNDDSDNSLVSGRSSCTAAAAATEPSVVTNIEVIEETVIAKSHQEVVTVPIDLNFVTTEDVVMTEQFVDVESSVNDATAHDDSLLASDSSAFTAATEPTIVIEETDITESQREVTTVPTGSYFVTTEDVVTEELFVDVESTVNDAIADNENPLAPDSSALTATAATEPNVVTNIKVIEETDITEPQQEVTTVPTGSYFVTTEDVVTEELFVDVESSVNDSIADAIADAIADNDNRLAPENSVFTAVNKIETFNKNSESQHEQKVASVNLESIPVSTPGDSGTADDEVHMCVTVSDTQHVIVTSTSTAAGVSDVFVLPVGEELDVDAVKNSEVLNVSVVAGKSPGIPGTSRALILPPPPSVTNAGSKMRMRIEAANKEKLPASATVKKCQKNRSVTVDPNETLASSLVAEQAPQISTVHKRTRAGRGSRWSNSDIEVSIPPTDSGLSCGDESSELVEEESKSQEQSQPTDKKESVSVVDWRPPPTKSAALDITVEGGVVSDEKSSSELCDKVSDCQKQSELAAEEQKIASLLDWRPPPSRTSAQHPTAPSEVKSLLEWKPTPGWRPKSTPVEIGQVSGSNVEPSVSPVRSQSANIPFCPPQNATHDQDLRNPMLDGQRPLPNVAHPVPGQMPVVIMSQPSLSAPPCNVQLPGASLAPPIVPPNAAQPVVPSSVVAGQTSCGQQVMMTVQPPPQIGLAPAPTVPPPLPVQPATVPPPMVVTGAGHSGQPPVPGVVLPPVVSSVQAQTPPRVMPVNHQPPPASFSQPPAGLLPFPAPNVSPQSQVGPNCGQPLPPGIVQPAMPQPERPVQGPPPANVRFGQNHPPHPHPGLLPHPRMAPHPVPPPQTVPHVRYPPQQFIPPRGPPAHVMASGPRQPPPQWGPVPPPHAAPPMWGPPRHGIPPAHFNQPHPDVRNPAVLHEWRPPHVNPPGAPYMQPGLPGPNWRPPMDCRPPDQGWWAPPAGVPQWGPPHGPPDWSYGAAAEPSTTGSEPSVPNYTAETAGCDNETASLAQAAREWADWQQRYAEWYYTYYGYSAAPVPSASSTTCNTVVTTVSVTSSASFTEKNASKNSFSAIPLPAKEAVAKSGTADAFAKFAEKAASDVNYTLGISSNKPSQNIASVSVSSSTNVSSTSVKPSQGECFLFSVA